MNTSWMEVNGEAVGQVCFRGCDLVLELSELIPFTPSQWGPGLSTCRGQVGKRDGGGWGLIIHQLAFREEKDKYTDSLITTISRNNELKVFYCHVFEMWKRNQTGEEAVLMATFAFCFATLAFLKDSHMSCGYSVQVDVSFLTREWEE